MALLLGLAMLPAGAIAMQVGLNAVAAQQSAYEESLSRRALQAMQSEQGLIDQLRELLRVLATSPAIQRAQTGDCQRWFTDVQAEYPYVATIAVTGRGGEIICSVPQATPDAAADPGASTLRDVARERDDLAVGYVAYGRLTHQPVLAALQPVHDAGGRHVGFVGVSIAIATLQQALERDRQADVLGAWIMDGSGRVIAQSQSPVLAPGSWPAGAQIRHFFRKQPTFVSGPGADAVIVPLQAPDLFAVMSWTPRQQTWRTWLGYVLSVAAPLIIWLLAVAAGWFAIEIYVARPLSSVEAAARSYARGEDVADTATLLNAPIEIRSLRRTLAAMAKTLRGREARLVETLSEERALLREVHHRVKNNLQMVASLLSIQSRGARDESEAWGLARAYDRVQLLSQVHQRIYSSGEIREIRLDELAADIARQMLASRGLTQKVQLDLHLSDARVDADRAVSMAFLIGEGLSTALDVIGETECTQLSLWLVQDSDRAMRFAIDADAAGGDLASATTVRLIDAFARQLGAQIGRNPDRPFMMWVYVPARTYDDEKAAKAPARDEAPAQPA